MLKRRPVGPRPVFSFSASFSDRTLDRDSVFAWLHAECDSQLLGIHEGTELTRSRARSGQADENRWVFDEGLAPADRDWVRAKEAARPRLFFHSRVSAIAAKAALSAIPGIRAGSIREEKSADWNARWRASYRGVFVPPCWRIVPPGLVRSGKSRRSEIRVTINPGAGFGTGTHPTTQLCLSALSRYRPQRIARALDFGTGSGILAIALAKLGAQAVDAVEIDELAIDNARENARRNGVARRIHLGSRLPRRRYDLVVANILRETLSENAEKIASRLGPGGTLILSGLLEPDLKRIRSAFGPWIQRKPCILKLRGWRALVWEQASPARSL